jgi:hypothetical protein
MGKDCKFFSTKTYQSVTVRKLIQTIKEFRRSCISSQEPKGVLLVSFGQSSHHDHFIVATHAIMPRVDRTMAVLMKMCKWRGRSHVEIWSHKGTGVTGYLQERETHTHTHKHTSCYLFVFDVLRDTYIHTHPRPRHTSK